MFSNINWNGSDFELHLLGVDDFDELQSFVTDGNLLIWSNLSEVGLEIVDIGWESWVENVLQVEVPDLGLARVVGWRKIGVLKNSLVLEDVHFRELGGTREINHEVAECLNGCSIAVLEESWQEFFEVGDLLQLAVVEFVDCVVVIRNLNFNKLLSSLLRWILDDNCKLVIFCIRRTEKLMVFLEV